MLKKYTLIILLLTLNLFSEEIINNVNSNINLDLKNIIENEYNLNKNSWFDNPTLSYNNNTTNVGNETINKDFYELSLNQDIIKVTNLINNFDYAKVFKKLDLKKIDDNENNLELSIIHNVLKLKILNNNIQIQSLSSENNNILLKILKTKYANGNSDIIDLNNMITNIHNTKNLIKEFQSQKIEILEYLSNYSNITDINEISNIITKEDFINKNKNIDIKKIEYDVSKVNYDLSKISLLPKVSLNYDIKKFTNNIDSDIESVGIKLYMPLDINSNKKIELSKLKQLKESKEIELIKIKEENRYKRIIESINLLDEKINLSKESLKTYDEIIDTINDNISLGFKSKQDLIVMNNNKLIEDLNIKNYELNKLLLIYELNKSIIN